MFEYIIILFNKEAFFVVLKGKYYDYNNNYTKYTRPFLNALVLFIQQKQIKTKDFIKLFYQVLANLKNKKLLNKVKRANLFLYALLDRIRLKIVKKHNMDQDNRNTLIYTSFYKTALRVYKANKIINCYKKSQNPIILSSKVSIVNKIIKALNTKKGAVPTAPIAYLALVQPKIPAPVLAINRMFLRASA